MFTPLRVVASIHPSISSTTISDGSGASIDGGFTLLQSASKDGRNPLINQTTCIKKKKTKGRAIQPPLLSLFLALLLLASLLLALLIIMHQYQLASKTSRVSSQGECGDEGCLFMQGKRSPYEWLMEEDIEMVRSHTKVPPPLDDS